LADEGKVKSDWIVRWRGLDERWPSAQDAMDRREELETRGIEAELLEVVDGRWRRVGDDRAPASPSGLGGPRR
jgi:hypothetical protein